MAPPVLAARAPGGTSSPRSLCSSSPLPVISPPPQPPYPVPAADTAPDPDKGPPDSYACPANFPDCMVDLVEVLSRGSNRGPDPSPQPDDIEKLQAHCEDEMEIHIPKLYEKKSPKEGGDPIHFKGKDHFADILRLHTCDECSLLLSACHPDSLYSVS